MTDIERALEILERDMPQYLSSGQCEILVEHLRRTTSRRRTRLDMPLCFNQAAGLPSPVCLGMAPEGADEPVVVCKRCPYCSANSHMITGRRSTGMKDRHGTEVIEGDTLSSILNGVIVKIRFGVYKAWCPHDLAEMPNVGFYAENRDGLQMPIGDMPSWAVIIARGKETAENA